MVVKAPDMTYFWHRKALFKHWKHELLGGSEGMLPQEIFKKEHSKNVVSSVSGNQVSVFEAMLEYTQIFFKKFKNI